MLRLISGLIVLILVLPLAALPVADAGNVEVDVYVYFNNASQRYHNLYIYYKDPYLKLKQYLIRNFPKGYSESGQLARCMILYYNKDAEKFGDWLKRLGVKGLYAAGLYASSLLVISLLNESLDHDINLIKARKIEIAEAYLHLLSQHCNDTRLTETDKVNIVIEVLPIKRVTLKEIDRFWSIAFERLGRLLNNSGFTLGRAAEWFDVIIDERWPPKVGVTMEEVYDQIRIAAREAFGRDVPVPVIITVGPFTKLAISRHSESLGAPGWLPLAVTILVGAASALSLALLWGCKGRAKRVG